MIKLKKSVTCKAKKIEVACITTNEPSEGDKCTVTGWGTLKSNGKQPKKLMKVDVPIISRSQCNENQWYGGAITDNMICAGYTKGKKDSCQGDSGGPFICNGKLAGVVSFGIGCARPDLPGIYTNVKTYVDWIEGNSVTPTTVAPTSVIPTTVAPTTVTSTIMLSSYEIINS